MTGRAHARQREIAQMVGQMGRPRIGTVLSVNAIDGTAKVSIQPEGIESGWLPIMVHGGGSGWAIVAPPSPGEQVLVIPHEGDADNGIIVGKVTSNQSRPPQTWSNPTALTTLTPIQPGEIGLIGPSGVFLRIVAGGVMVNGDLHVNGDVYDRHGSMDRLRGNYDVHTHGGIFPGGSNTSTTSAPDAE